MKVKQEKNFENVVDIRKLRKIATKTSKPPVMISREAKRAAQELIYDAWETDNKKRRIKMAKEALSIFPDCADAYNILAQDAAKSLQESEGYYRQGMQAGRRDLGEKTFKKDIGYFWEILETRPYMRAQTGLMQCSWAQGNHQEAIDHARELLQLNNNDNQGIRYVLITYLANLGRYDELENFMNGEYKEDGMAEWLYTRVMLSFARTGDTPQTRKLLSVALSSNRYVPYYLLKKKKIPLILPETITVGGQDEAYCYAATNLLAWENVPGLLIWLEQQSKNDLKGV